MRTRHFTPDQVAEIRARWGSGQSAMAICDEMALAVAPELVYKVATGRLYADLNETCPPHDRGHVKVADDETIVRAIANLTTLNGYPPSVREVAEAVGLKSPAGAKAALDRARERGLVTWVPGKARTLRVLEVA